MSQTLTIHEALQLAVQHHQAGDLPLAQTIYQKILEVDPNNSDALHLSGLIAHHARNYREALDLIQKAVHINPHEPNFYNSLGNIFQKLGQCEKAIENFQQALAISPNEPGFHYNLGVSLKLQNNIPQAIIAYQRALALNPDYAEAHNGLGHILREQGQFAQATEHLQKALELKPRFAEAHNEMGIILLEQGHLEKAITCHQRAIAINPNMAEFHNNLGNALKKQGKFAEAVNCYRHALMLTPHVPGLHYNLGSVLLDQGQVNEAIESLYRALDLEPNYADAYNNLGIAFETLTKPTEAITSYQRALALRPQWAEAHNNLANALKDKGLVREAIASYQKAMELAPHDAIIHSNFLYILNFSRDYDATAIFKAHQQFDRYSQASFQTYPNEPHLSRRLKIGYVSADFRRHPVAYFFEPILTHHDHQKFEIICYYNKVQTDDLTLRLQGDADHWVPCASLSDEVLAQRIRQDQIDILVDLSGHIAEHRLLVFAKKPAPIQVTYLGYPNTTGLTSIDYHITDSYIDPEGVAETLNSEIPLRMPASYYCYLPPFSPPVNELPALKNGYITFGSFNSCPKLNSETLALWNDLLRALPNSRLVIMTPSFHDIPTRQSFEQQLVQLGIDRSRLTLGYAPSAEEVMKSYYQIDIALDTFPFNGATTTCEALWMGVPVVTLVGKTHVSRVGLSLLSSVGLTEFLTRTPQEYMNKCVSLTQDISALQSLRTTLRTRMQNSPLMDALSFTRHLERMYRRIWVDWCIKMTERTQETS